MAVKTVTNTGDYYNGQPIRKTQLGNTSVTTNYDITPDMAAGIEKSYQEYLDRIRADELQRQKIKQISNNAEFKATGVGNTIVGNIAQSNLSQPVSTNSTQANSQSMQPYYTSNLITDYLRQARTQQTQAGEAALTAARNQRLSNLQAERTTIAPQYYNKRNEESVSSQMRAKKLGEIMSANGYSEGFEGQKQLGLNVATQGNIGLLKRQEQAANDDITRRTTDSENQYTTDLAMLRANSEAEGLRDIANQMNTDRQYGLQERQIGNQENQFNRQFTEGQRQFDIGQYNYQQQFAQARNQQELDNTFRQAQADIQNQLNNRQMTNQEAQAALDNAYREKTLIEQQRQFNTGQSNWQQQFGEGQRQFNEQIGFQKSQADIDNYYRQAQSDIENKYRQGVFDAQQVQAEKDNLFRSQQFEESVRQFNVGQSNWQTQFTYQQAQDKIQNALTNQRISQEAAQMALQQARLKAEQDPNSLDNQIKRAQLNMAQGAAEADIRAKAAQIASSSGMFDQATFNTVYNALKGSGGNASGLNEYFR